MTFVAIIDSRGTYIVKRLLLLHNIAVTCQFNQENLMGYKSVFINSYCHMYVEDPMEPAAWVVQHSIQSR